MAHGELSMAKDKAGKSPQRQRKPEKSDCVVFSNNLGALDKYAEHGTSVALFREAGLVFFKRRNY